MSEQQESEAGHDEERRRNRPYRRLVGIFFGLAILALSVLFLRGIIRALDRLPSASVAVHQGVTDVRALTACAEDLERLDRRIRQTAGELFARAEQDSVAGLEWQEVARPFEVDRLNVVARCGLDENTSDPVILDLRAASQAIEGLLRSYGLLYARHLEDGAERSLEGRDAIKRALSALETRTR